MTPLFFAEGEKIFGSFSKNTFFSLGNFEKGNLTPPFVFWKNCRKGWSYFSITSNYMVINFTI